MIIKRIVQTICLVFFLVQAVAAGQAGDVKRILSEIRAALGGEQKIGAVKSVAIEGQATRVLPEGASMAREFAIAIDLGGAQPKFEKREVVANLGGNVINRRSGFNGSQVIDEVDGLPGMEGGGMRVMRRGPNGPVGPDATPEQIAEQQKFQLMTSRREFARLALVLFASSTAAYPVEITYAGQVDDGGVKSDVLEAKAADGFTCKLFVDAKTRLPLMVSWMDREPAGGTGAPRMVTATSPDEAARAHEDMMARAREAEAKRRTVEFRVLYSEFKTVDGVKVPTRIVHMIDGRETEELKFSTIKVR